MISNFREEVKLKRSKLKKEIRETSGNCNKILLILGILIQLFGISMLLIIKPNLGQIDEDFANYLLGYLPCIIGDIVAIISAIKLTNIKIRKDMFCKIEVKTDFIILSSLACIGIGIISNLVYSMYEYILKSLGVIIPTPDFNFPTNNPKIMLLMLSYVCVLGPILEEIIFRGFILKSLQKYGNLMTIIVTSILFGIFHMNLVQLVPPILIGFLLGYITIKSKSIVPSIIAHIFNNTISFVIAFVENGNTLIQHTIFIIYILIALGALIYFIRKYKKDIRMLFKEKNIMLKLSKKIVVAFSGKWAILYIVFYTIIIVLGFVVQ